MLLRVRVGLRGAAAGAGAGASEATAVAVAVREVTPWYVVREAGSLEAWLPSGRRLALSLCVVAAAAERGAAEVAEIRVLVPLAGLAELSEEGEGEVEGAAAADDDEGDDDECAPGRSLVLYVSYRLRTTLLHAQEYPAAVHHGFDLPSARVEACAAPASGDGGGNGTGSGAATCVRARAEALRLELAAPDMSMPFNVVTLASTALAYTLGSIINAAARQPRARAGGGA